MKFVPYLPIEVFNSAVGILTTYETAHGALVADTVAKLGAKGIDAGTPRVAIIEVCAAIKRVPMIPKERGEGFTADRSHKNWAALNSMVNRVYTTLLAGESTKAPKDGEKAGKSADWAETVATQSDKHTLVEVKRAIKALEKRVLARSAK